MSPLLVENVTKHFRQGDRDVTALSGISLDIKQGNFLAIMGASGSGKSTLLHLIAGLDAADSGDIRLDDCCISKLSDAGRAALRRDRLPRTARSV